MSPSRVRLGDIADFVNGVAFKPDDWEESGKRILRIQNLTDSTKPFNRTNRAVAKKYEVSPGDLLVSWSATLGVFVWEGPDTALVNQHIFRVVPDHGRIDPCYLRHMLSDALVQMEQHLHGATMKHVNRGEFLATTIPLPSLDKQKRIAGILDAADALRAKRREALAQLDTLIQSTFLDMFGDPVTNTMGWKVVSVGDEIRFLTSGSRGWAKYYAKGGDTFIRIQNLKDGQLDLGDIAFVNAPESAEAKRTKVEPGDVLLSITADLGRTAVVPRGIAKAHINQHLAILRFTSLNPVFVSYQLASKGGQAQFDRLNREGVKAGLNFHDVKSIRLTNPPLKLQHRFAAIVESVEQQKASQRAHLAELDTLFASLQSRAFLGDL